MIGERLWPMEELSGIALVGVCEVEEDEEEAGGGNGFAGE